MNAIEYAGWGIPGANKAEGDEKEGKPKVGLWSWKVG